MLKHFEINGITIELACETYQTRNSWGHKCTLFVNGYEYGKAKIRYYNRTWESYQYQSVMYKAVRERIKEKLESECEYTYKRLEGKKRVSQKMRDDMEQQLLEFDDEYIALESVLYQLVEDL